MKCEEIKRSEDRRKYEGKDREVERDKRKVKNSKKSGNLPKKD